MPKFMPVFSSLSARNALYEKFKSKIIHNPILDRNLVSYQGNKQARFSAWFKYREGFSERLVTYILETVQPKPGILLDPFSGSGTSLFTASELGWKTTGIELLPVGIFATEARIIARKINNAIFSIQSCCIITSQTFI
jgi:DNA modification methylase